MVKVNLEDRYKEFIGYFELGFPAGWGDLVRKAEELNLPIPQRRWQNGEMILNWEENK